MGSNKITGLADPTNSQDAVTINYLNNTVLAPSNLTGVITSVGNLTSIASQTGTGSTFVVQTSPSLTTPTLTDPAFSGQVSTDIALAATRTIIFEGATDNAYETTLTVVDPTQDRTITFPDATGTVTLDGVASVTSGNTNRITVGGTATAPTVDLSTSGVTAATYTLSTITVDAYGRITSASTGTAQGETFNPLLLMGA
jgi:hypothetical protein